MNDSILTTIKKLLGLEENDTSFDTDIIININSVFMTLNQIGVGPSECFFIDDKIKTWTNFLGEDVNFGAVKTYVYLKVRLVFDPPTTSSVIDAMERQIKEIEWRLNIQAEKTIVEGVS